VKETTTSPSEVVSACAATHQPVIVPSQQPALGTLFSVQMVPVVHGKFLECTSLMAVVLLDSSFGNAADI
jgi:hypothetical protein